MDYTHPYTISHDNSPKLEKYYVVWEYIISYIISYIITYIFIYIIIYINIYK